MTHTALRGTEGTPFNQHSNLNVFKQILNCHLQGEKLQKHVSVLQGWNDQAVLIPWAPYTAVVKNAGIRDTHKVCFGIRDLMNQAVERVI